MDFKIAVHAVHPVRLFLIPCSFCLWEDNKFFSSKKKKLTKKIAKELLDKGWCRVTGLYTPKKPQLYDAVIRLDDSGGKYVSFKMEFDR